MRKFVLVIQDGLETTTNLDINTLLHSNKQSYDVLTFYKNKITEYYKSKLWDRYKKLTNEYEMIFTTPNTGTNISLYQPVSRSFFKMWEMLYDFKSELVSTHPMNVMFLAEGPGGFAEAVIKFRNQQDSYYGISLKSVNKNIPEWKYQNAINICYGEDGTGDLYNINNIHYLAKNHPKMDLITADGGFDFSSDFNSQEELSLRLILCEIYSALCLQKENANFILKIYDVFQEHTLKTICYLKQFYKKIYILKPLSSRPANSEKYLICIGYTPNIIQANNLGNLIKTYTLTNLTEFFANIPYNTSTLHNIICYNIYYSLRQIYYIEQTISYINHFGKKYQDDSIKAAIKNILQSHRQKAVRWCVKYNLDHA